MRWDSRVLMLMLLIYLQQRHTGVTRIIRRRQVGEQVQFK